MNAQKGEIFSYHLSLGYTDYAVNVRTGFLQFSLKSFPFIDWNLTTSEPNSELKLNRQKYYSLSHVQLFAIPWTISHQALLSMKLSSQEYWRILSNSIQNNFSIDLIKYYHIVEGFIIFVVILHFILGIFNLRKEECA